ncbi:MAG: lipopolysaccharide kinase InaA family protein [Planctomycetota bacterium]
MIERKKGGLRGLFRKDTGLDMERWLEAPDELANNPPDGLFVKSCERRGFKWLFDFLTRRMSRARLAWWISVRLERKGVPAVRVLAAIERRSSRSNWTVMERLQGNDLRQFLLLHPANEEFPWKRELIRALAEVIALLHARGALHQPDLKAQNIWMEPVNESEGAWRARLIDLEGMVRRRGYKPYLRARDLARLCTSFRSEAFRERGFTRDDWRSLLLEYRALFETFADRPVPDKEIDWWMELTESWAERKERKNAAEGRATY